MANCENKNALLFVGPQHIDDQRRITRFARRAIEQLDPLGIAIVSTFLKKYGFQTELRTLNPDPKTNYLTEIENADVVLVSSREFDTDMARQIIQTANRLGKKTIAGGYGPTFNPEGFSDATARVIGEAEPILDQLIDDLLSNHSLPPVYDSTQLPPFDLSDYTWPDRTIFPPSRNPFKQHTQEWQRGCSNRCSFCAPSRLQRSLRFRSVGDIVAEIDAMGLKRGDYLFSVDLNTTAIPPEQMEELFLQLRQRGLRWSTEGTIAFFLKDYKEKGEESLLNLMSAKNPKFGGCYSFLYGADDLTLKQVPGSLDKYLSDLKTAIDLFRHFSIPLNLSVVVGLDNHVFPGSFFQIASILEALSPAYSFLHIATPLKGTPWGNNLREDGRIIDNQSDHYNHRRVVHQPKNMTAEQLQQGYYWLLRTLYSPDQIVRSFQKNFPAYLFPQNPVLATIVSGILWQTETLAGIKEFALRGFLDPKMQQDLDSQYRQWKGEPKHQPVRSF